MKIVAVFLVVCLFGLISAEKCTDKSQCVHTLCDATSHMECLNNICSCVENGPDGTKCTTKAECDGLQNWDCPARRRHCVDNKCYCSRW